MSARRFLTGLTTVLLTLLILSSSIITAGCKTDGTSNEIPSITQEPGVNMLTLTLELDRETFQSGDAIPVTLVLTNQGHESLLVNSRMAPNHPHAPDPQRDIVFVITAPSGQEMPLNKFINVHAPKEDDFVVLAVGETAERTIYLEQILSFVETGEYSIQAIYQNATDPGTGESAWKGQISSEKLMFKMEG